MLVFLDEQVDGETGVARIAEVISMQRIRLQSSHLASSVLHGLGVVLHIEPACLMVCSSSSSSRLPPDAVLQAIRCHTT
jgi:hypothetical protein